MTNALSKKSKEHIYITKISLVKFIINREKINSMSFTKYIYTNESEIGCVDLKLLRSKLKKNMGGNSENIFKITVNYALNRLHGTGTGPIQCVSYGLHL